MARVPARAKGAKGRTPSSGAWLRRQQSDPYVAEARRLGYRSRAAFKLIEIDDRFHLLRRGLRVVDLGASPGGWTQVAAARIEAATGRGGVVGVDLLDTRPVAGASLLRGDFRDPATADAIKRALGGRAHLVLSDMAAPATGHRAIDHLRAVVLAEAALLFAIDALEPGGAFLAKIFQGGGEGTLLPDLRRAFAELRHVKPRASRAESAETYLVARGFRGAA
jgi:23S rRNA (uridine2552-2'-O)-methyltransferase